MRPKPYILSFVLVFVVAAVTTSCREAGTDDVVQARYAKEDEALRSQFAAGFVRLGGRDLPVTTGTAPGYVSDDVCQGCHVEVADSYHHVGMARAFAKPGPETRIEDFEADPFHHAPSARYYEMRYRDGGYYLRRFQRDDDGEPYNELEEQIDYIIGSGSNVRSYVYQTEAGELYQAPLAWYPRDDTWGMPPGYEKADHSGFLRQVTRDCMFCHASYPDMPVGSDHMRQPQRFPTEMTSGLGCQRCHGPGARHIEVANDRFATEEQLRSSIVNPSRLDPELRDDVCMQCHFQPDSQIMSLVRRPGRGFFSYRPGQALSDYITPVDHSAGPVQRERFQINHHPYRLFQSACYVESDGAMSCLTCHDPHVKVPEDERPAHYRAACLSCHQLEQCDIAAMQSSVDAEGSLDCTDCHMVRRRTQDVISVVMTDHFIRRTPPETDLTARRGRPERRTPADPFASWPDRDPQASVQVAMARCAANDPVGIEALEAAIDEGRTDSVDAKIMLADAYWNGEKYGEAIRWYEEIIAELPDLAHAHEMYGRCQIQWGQVEQGLESLDRAWALDDESATTAFGLGLALSHLGRTDEALARFQQAIKLRPNYPEAHLNVGKLLTNARDYPGAIATLEQVHRIDPRHEEGYYFHGLAQLRSGGTIEAGTTWQRGLRAAPTSARLHLAFATALVMSGRTAEAERLCERAREFDADPIDLQLIEALINSARGRRAAALERWRSAAGGLSSPSSTPVLRAVLVQLARQQFEG